MPNITWAHQFQEAVGDRSRRGMPANIRACRSPHLHIDRLPTCHQGAWSPFLGFLASILVAVLCSSLLCSVKIIAVVSRTLGTDSHCWSYGLMNQIVTELDTIAAEAKLASGLVYVPGLETGITRRMGKNGSLYYRPDGRRITEASEIARLNALAIPPAYTDVIISTNPFSHLQAIGRDARGRRQYRYHPDWHAERGKSKFEKLVAFADRLPDLRERMDGDLRSRRLNMEKALATVVWMLDNLYIRIGNTAYAEENKSYGLTTLRSRHVKVEGGSIRFRFKGKSGKEWNLAHSDRRIANVVRQLQELPGQHLFQYVCDESGCRQVSSHDVNAYIRETTGDDFSSRQFRTWGATCMAVDALASVEAATNKRELARQLNVAIDLVAAKLVNTRSVCRSSYIHPGVFEDFQAGRLREVLKLQSKSERLLQWMDDEEVRVLRWLKKRSSQPATSHYVSLFGLQSAEETVSEPSGVALIVEEGSDWRLIDVAPSYDAFISSSDAARPDRHRGSVPNAAKLIEAAASKGGREVDLVAIDMPLSLTPIVSRRTSDNLISSAYGAKHASTHTHLTGGLGRRLSNFETSLQGHWPL